MKEKYYIESKESKSILAVESKAMERSRRIVEQSGESKFAPVNAKERPTEEIKSSPAGELQNSIRENPLLMSQRHDGQDPSLNANPSLNSEAKLEYDNQVREQEQEKRDRLELQLGLQHMPRFSSTPTPRP